MTDAPTGWAKLDLQVGVLLEAVAVDHGHGPIAVAYWTMLLVHGKTGDVFGEVTTTAKRFARAVFDSKARPSLWQAFADEGLVELVEGTFAGRFTVRLHEEYRRVQTPRGKTGAERQAASRAREREAAQSTQESGTRDGATVTPTPVRDGGVTERVTTDRRQETGDVVLSVESTPAKTRPARIAARSPEQVAAEISEHRTKLNGLGSLVDELVQSLAGENTTGKVSEGRTLNALWRPIAGLLDTYDRAAVRHGLEVAIAANDGAGAPNANFVKKVAAGFRPATAPRPTTAGEATPDDRRTSYTAPDLTW